MQKYDPRGLSVQLLDGLTVTAEEIRNTIGSVGLFTTKRFIAINYYDPTVSAMTLEKLEPLVRAAADGDDSIIVIRDTSTAKKATGKKSAKGRKTVVAKKSKELAGARIEQFPKLTPVELRKWMRQEIKALGVSMTPAAIERLIIYGDEDTWKISNELAKLAAYVNQKTIDVAEVDLLVVSPFATDIFALTDSIGERRTKRSLQLIHQELGAGTHPLALIATFARHIRTLYAVQQAISGGMKMESVASVLGLHPYVVQKAASQSKQFAARELRDWHHRLIDCDKELKTSPVDAETLLQLLVVKS